MIFEFKSRLSPFAKKSTRVRKQEFFHPYKKKLCKNTRWIEARMQCSAVRIYCREVVVNEYRMLRCATHAESMERPNAANYRQPIVVWVLSRLSYVAFQVAELQQGFSSHSLVRLTDFLVHKSLLGRGRWSAAAVLRRRHGNRNKQNVVCTLTVKTW